MSKLVFIKGNTDPIGDCGNFAAGLDVEGWGNRIEVYGSTPADAEALRDKFLEVMSGAWVKTSERQPRWPDTDPMGRILVWNEFSGFSHLLHIDHITSQAFYTHWQSLPSSPFKEDE